MSDVKPASRRRHDAELKRKVIAACATPGASVAQAAVSYGLNANLVHKWRRLASDDGEVRSSPTFVSVSVVSDAPACEPQLSIELELQRGSVHVRVRWPMRDAKVCAAWLRELLRQPVLHGDETPVAMLKPAGQRDGTTHRAYLWSYCSTQFSPLETVVFDFADGRGGQHARDFLGLPQTPAKPGLQNKLVCDDFAGYKACFDLGVTEVGCMAHARRKFHELWANHGSQVGEQALKFFGQLYEVERTVADADSSVRFEARQADRPLADALHQWLRQQRQRVPDGSAPARSIDYSLERRAALTRYLDDGNLPIDNNWAENRIRPIALGRQNWLFAGSLRAGKRAAAVMSLIQSAKLNGLDLQAYLHDVLERLPTHPASLVDALLPHRWQLSAIRPKF